MVAYFLLSPVTSRQIAEACGAGHPTQLPLGVDPQGRGRMLKGLAHGRYASSDAEEKIEAAMAALNIEGAQPLQ